MAEFALFFGGDELVPGREQTATRVFSEIMEYFGRLHYAGQVMGVEPFFLEPHGGKLSGFVIVHGEREALARIRSSDEFARLTLRASMVAQRVGVVAAATRAELNRQLAEFEQDVGDLT